MCVFQGHVTGIQSCELPPTAICFACAPAMYLHTRRSYTLGGVDFLRGHRSSCCFPHVVVVEIEFLVLTKARKLSMSETSQLQLRLHVAVSIAIPA
jgi:hypothetical protein